MSDQRISVAVRIRPPIERERYEPVCARKADDDQTIIIKTEETSSSVGGTSAFQFDYVFDETDDQQAVYEESVQEMVDHALSGFNATVFTYGQTGSGKTYTILGKMSSDGQVTEDSGMFLRVFDDLFTYKESVKDRIHILITLSAMELYVEEVMDLLSSKKKLKLRETPEETLTMGINIVEVHTMADVVHNFEVANSFRSVTATKMNDTSSRSHALFFIDLFQVPADKSPQSPVLSQLIDANGSPTTQGCPGIIRSRIALVDLAGSERVKRSGVTGQAMVEAQAINKSLSTLGTVINAMYTQSPHIPFRESKLTKLLKPCFVETTSRLLLIGQVAPPSNSASESLGTLRFCDRVKGLKAGQVMGFSDPEAEEAYLKSRRLNEELLAEMHILRAQYYYEPVNLKGLAEAHGVPLEQEKQRVTAELQAGAEGLVERKEQEALLKAEAAANAARDTEVEQFVLHMNSLIEEYEEVARDVKKEKKTQKKVHEEQEAEQEARLHEAKKAKKHRLRAEEALAAAQLQLQTMDEEAHALDIQIEAVRKDATAAAADDVEIGTNAAVDTTVEEATHRLVESFYNHAMEQSRLYSLYVTRLSATGRERSQVRRVKLMSSTLVTDGTLLYDLIAFLVDRAVDIAEGDIVQDTKWGWYDVDGLSQRLLCADEMFPPLLPAEFEPLDADAQPCAEEAHDITFLSSDESDDTHSHHAAESRRIRQIRDAAAAAKANGGAESDLVDADVHGEAAAASVADAAAAQEDGAASDTNRDSGDESPATAPQAHVLDWMSGGIIGETPPPPPSLGDAGPFLDVITKTHHHHRKKKAGGAAVEAEAAETTKMKTAKRESWLTAQTASPVADTTDATSVGEEETEEEADESSGTESTQTEEEEENSSLDVDDEAGNAQAAARKVPKDAAKKKREKKKKAAKEGGATANVPPVDAPNPSYREKDARALMKVYDSPTLVQDLIRFLRSGSRMLKHCRRGKPHERIFWVSTQRGKKDLFWKAPESRSADHACIHLADVSYIQLGCFSKVFSRHRIPPGNPAFYRAFTIGLRRGGRTVDIVAESLPDYEAWVVGLANLIGVDPVWGGKIDLTREVGTDRLTYFESSCCEANYIQPLQYLELKKRVQHVATRTMQVLSDCGNDAAKAQAILGGIHLPAVNDKGAVYMTKGEMRFLMGDTFDIFRISRLWMLFQQMNLVYDDAFTPATAFGITQRES